MQDFVLLFYCWFNLATKHQNARIRLKGGKPILFDITQLQLLNKNSCLTNTPNLVSIESIERQQNDSSENL